MYVFPGNNKSEVSRGNIHLLKPQRKLLTGELKIPGFGKLTHNLFGHPLWRKLNGIFKSQTSNFLNLSFIIIFLKKKKILGLGKKCG